MSLVDYGLCRQTVTVYRQEAGQLQRLVVNGCYYAYEDVCDENRRFDRKFLLVMPGVCQRVFPGDRIYDGVGPEEVDWQTFIPVQVAGLSEVAYVRPWFYGGVMQHLEAGRK